MIELMAMLIIIGLLGTLVATKVVSKIDQARVTTTKTNLKELHRLITSFYMDLGRYPTEDEGLDALIEAPMDIDIERYPEGGYLETTDLPLDAWKNEFIYELYPESGQPFVIISYGADGQEGGEGKEADLYSTDAD